MRSFAPVTALVVLAAGCIAAGPSEETSRREAIFPDGRRPGALYAPAVRADDLLFLSGSIGMRPGAGLAEGGTPAETRQALDNIRATLEAAGATPADVAKCTVFLADIADYRAMNEVYGEFFGDDPPARTAVAVAGLPAAARVEIECIAVAPR